MVQQLVLSVECLTYPKKLHSLVAHHNTQLKESLSQWLYYYAKSIHPTRFPISPPIHSLSISHHNHSLSSRISPRSRNKQTTITTNRYAMKWIGCPKSIFTSIGAPLPFSGERDAPTTVMLHGIRSETTHTTDLVGVVKDQSSPPLILSPCTRWLLVLTVVRRDWLAHQNNGFKEHNER